VKRTRLIESTAVSQWLYITLVYIVQANIATSSSHISSQNEREREDNCCIGKQVIRPGGRNRDGVNGPTQYLDLSIDSITFR